MRTASFVDVLGAEGSKAWRQPSARLVASIFLGYCLLIVVSLTLALRGADSAGPQAGPIKALIQGDPLAFVGSALTGVASILVVIFACQNTGQEFARGTFRTLLLSGATRRGLGSAKFILALVVAVTATFLVVIASVLGARAFADALGGAQTGITSAGILALARHCFVPLACWGIIAVGSTLLTRSQGAGLGIALGSLVGGDVVNSVLRSFGSVAVWASRLLPNTSIEAAAMGAPAHDWLWIFPDLMVYVVGVAVWAVVAVERMDVLAATK